MNTYQRRTTIHVGLIAAALLGVAGCKTNEGMMGKINRQMPWYDEVEPQHGVPDHMVGNWTDTILYKAGQKPQRGFGGRVLFYPEKGKGEKPILVDGQMVVYAFDEGNRNPTDNTPTRRYVFPAEQLQLRMSECDLGVSYNFWLPWDDLGGPQTDVSLITRFEPAVGPVIAGEQTRHRLPGANNVAAIAAANQKPQLPEGVPFRPAVEQPFKLPGPLTNTGVQTASFETAAPLPMPAAAGPTAVDNRVTPTLTIPLPGSMRNAGQSMPAHAANRAPQPQQMPAPVAGNIPAATVPTNQSAVPVLSPDAAAQMRAGGYRLLPQGTGANNSRTLGSSTMPTYPPPVTIQAGNGAATGAVQGYMLPAEGQPLLAPASQPQMPYGQVPAAGNAQMIQQQFNTQGFGSQPSAGFPASQMLPAGYTMSPSVSFPTR